MSRLENSFKNIVLSFGNTFVSSILSFISRTVFISTLGTEYLGLAGLLNNVLGFLSISELGIATAIGFSLYKPLAVKDYKTVSALMSLYRKAYTIIAGIVFTAGIGLFFFLDFFISPEQQPAGTGVAYFAFLLNTVFGYLLSYKTTLISSDNNAYKLVPINVCVNFVQTILQIVVLLTIRNYVAYIVVHIGCSIVCMILQNRYISNYYVDVDFNSHESLNPEIKHQIKRNIGGLMIAKIGDYLVNSTDNLIITKLVSLVATGIYSNYLMIRNMVNGFIATIFSGITASMGNVVAVESDEKKLEIFDRLMFCAFFVYSFEAVCFLCLFNPFIGELWLGEEYLFDTFTVAIIVANNFLTGLRIPLITMKGVAGKYMEDAWIPFAFAGVNLVASIVLVKYLGVAGVFMGTIIGSLLTADWYRPIVIYKNVFHAPVRLYYRKYLLYVVLGCAYMCAAYMLCNIVNTSNVVLDFIIKCIIAGGIPLLMNILLFYRSKEFIEVKNMGKRLFFSIKNKLCM